MAQKDFSLLSHPYPLPLVLQSDMHHKDPMFLQLLHFAYTYFISKIYSYSLPHLSSMGDFLIEGHNIDRSALRELFGIFCDT